MSLIQLILLIGVGILTVSYFRWFRSNAKDILVMSAIAIAGIIFILFPVITTRLANMLGVGRGVDLIFYLCIVGFSFALLILYSKIKNLERKLTELTRKRAIDEVSPALKDR